MDNAYESIVKDEVERRIEFSLWKPGLATGNPEGGFSPCLFLRAYKLLAD